MTQNKFHYAEKIHYANTRKLFESLALMVYSTKCNIYFFSSVLARWVLHWQRCPWGREGSHPYNFGVSECTCQATFQNEVGLTTKFSCLHNAAEFSWHLSPHPNLLRAKSKTPQRLQKYNDGMRYYTLYFLYENTFSPYSENMIH